MARDTKSDICRAAMDVIATKGVEGASLREIAEAVGITKASLYYHYASKQELVSALLMPLVDDMRNALAGLDQRPWSPAAVRVVLSDFIDAVVRHRDVGVWLARDVGALASFEDVLGEIFALTGRLHHWLAGPDPTVEDRIRAVAATEVVGGVLSSTLTVSDAPDQVLRSVLLEASLDVLKATSRAGAA
ncbi:TetR/AcrR family transcriptional regulator [Luteipulveratus sp. YIM 133132]|uniref:TetR/AcrR family transcriptional regulator n=1 Tax=Luteipulveratus flavus TaxID=3031728 RepID=UPI0023AFB5CB|nr:TetR/AcrR family transcriptional regulator [Luteipulveratus sp. YIM 133132]MDE9364359.1 TetR/AcrR family transcriptional regulator [Luteipulveratus sp. YIM 133132]